MDLAALLTGLTVPFAGTVAGAACVWLMRESMSQPLEKILTGFAAGVMVAASVWSLLIPAIDLSSGDGFVKTVPASLGFLAGMAFLWLLDHLTPHEHIHDESGEGPRSHLSRPAKLFLALTIHNIPEGIAVGVMLAGAREEGSLITVAAAIALCIGIAIQNFPEGAIVSMPLRGAGLSRSRAFWCGVASGAVEPVAAALTMLLAAGALPLFPCLLAFGAGTMLYVVVEELIPQTAQGSHSNLGTAGFAAGFVIMMVLDTSLG